MSPPPRTSFSNGNLNKGHCFIAEVQARPRNRAIFIHGVFLPNMTEQGYFCPIHSALFQVSWAEQLKLGGGVHPILRCHNTFQKKVTQLNNNSTTIHQRGIKVHIF